LYTRCLEWPICTNNSAEEAGTTALELSEKRGTDRRGKMENRSKEGKGEMKEDVKRMKKK
jgi:hypothetical protein